MVDISTQYLGIPVRSPLCASASPLSDHLDGIRALDDAQVGAIVISSLFEEQLQLSPEILHRLLSLDRGSYAEVLSVATGGQRTRWGPDEYLAHLVAAKAAVDAPIIASLNGAPTAKWAGFARLLERAGADGIELNLYHLPTDPEVSAARLEEQYFQCVREVRDAVSLPLAVKLHPYFTSLPHAARRFVEAGADALVLFNRFYQPDLDLESKRAHNRVKLSTSEDLRIPLRWTAMLQPLLPADIAVTGGVHTGEDALKAMALGAQVAMVCSTLLRHGIPHLGALHRRMRAWLEAHDFRKIDDFRGSMLTGLELKEVIHRAQYIRNLHGYDSARTISHS